MLSQKSIQTLIPIFWLVSLTLAEPPVGDGYPGSSHGDHSHDHGPANQRSLSQEYGPPNSGATRNAHSTGYEYNPPNARGQSRFPPATVRVSFNQRFGSADARSSVKDNALTPKSSSQGYSASTSRGISEEYGLPAARSLSQEYGVPSVVSARTLSTEYGMPDARSTPSEEYRVPVVAARTNPKSNIPSYGFRSAQPENYLATNDARSQFQTDSHTHSSSFGRSNDATKPFSFTSRTAPSSYDAPSRSQSLSSSRRSDSQNYDSDVASYASARPSPSSTYLPASRNAAPSEQYGVPENHNDDARARAIEEELRNQEPASYDFGYQIEDQESGSDFGHTETREENSAQGSYFVVLPDGNKQTVQYSADERGFQPRISVERAAGGYGEDAAGLGTSQGPY